MGADLNVLTMMLQSGIVVKIVLIFLIFFSILSWAIILQKRKLLKKIEEEDKVFIENFYSQPTLKDTFDLTKDHGVSGKSLMFKKGYEELTKTKELISANGESLSKYFRENNFKTLERSLLQGAGEASNIFEKNLSILASISSVSPFVGLLGTVWGIIDSFTGLSQGGGSIESVAPGISEALVATAIGLFAAIPANWFYNVLTTKFSQYETEMESFGQDFLNIIERNIMIGKK